MNINRIDGRFATTGQITPKDIAEIKRMGFSGIVCARPDNEERDQPSFDDIARAAKEAGLPIAHIPVSGMLTQGQVMRFEEAMAGMDGPVLGYCRSGARAGSLYATSKR
ncbi:TIGR01244 family sulfur transferase [Devosia nitrariae]|uniref:Oxidoreductase n=1 Tax=Devosia nitrariae TaxID=2071872 RepID=A0ABQ5WAR4_9HYPH|nr:TIGR01244 family sulfur transferase [Devosia nitrariae]GLQ56650.1 oxidoreductase [Devosia nitrariae]